MYAIKNEKYSNAQEIASAISGYEQKHGESSPRSEEYYESKTKESKISHIKGYGENVYKNPIILSDNEISKVYNFLENEPNLDSNGSWNLFEELY